MQPASQPGDPGLLIQARERGTIDIFTGKRRWIRYSLGMALEVSTDPPTASASWQVAMHNVSGGGVGIWSRRNLPAGTAIHIRDCVEGDTAVWLSGRVTHSTLGLRGHLLGIAFDQPAPPDADSHGALLHAHEEAVEQRPKPRAAAAVQSLRVKCAVGGAVVCGVVILAAYAAYHYLANRIGPDPAMAVGLGSGLLVGAVFGWLLVRRELQFIGSLQTALRDMASGKSGSADLEIGPCSELLALARAFQDLGTRWRQREHDERAQRQKLEDITRIKTNILSIVSHDLRTPLTSILLYAEMLKEQLDTLADEDRRSFIGVVCDECTRLSRLVDDLLEVQRLESDRAHFNLKPWDLSATVQACARVFQPLAQNKDMTLILECPETLPLVEADSDKIAQAVNNLISNALKYTPSGGTVRVSVEARDNEVLMCVADNGPGIPRDKWDHIFDRFSQLSDPNVCQIEGFGLGLYIVARVAEAHAGRTWVDSEPGKGAAFFVALPVAGSGSPRRIKRTTGTPSCRVLVCDSDPELAATIAQTVGAEGFDVRVAHSGQRLLQHLDHGDVDVLLADVVLPDMDAAELLDALNSRADRSFRTIVHTCDGDVTSFRRRGVDIYLKRPVSKDELIQAVRVASQRRSVAGLTVVLVDGPGVATERLSGALLEAGHVTMVAENTKEAAALARDYGGDVIVVSSRSLTSSWGNLKELTGAGIDQARVTVLCDTVRKKERQLVEEHGVTAVAYQPGREEAVVDVIMECEGELGRSLTHEPDHCL